jgi:hypothetical protein
MKRLMIALFKRTKKTQGKSLEAYKQEMLINVGREQFKTLLRKHLDIPVLFL